LIGNARYAPANRLKEMAAPKFERDTLRAQKQDDKQEIQRLILLLAKLQRALYGHKSEKLIHQIEQSEHRNATRSSTRCTATFSSSVMKTF
jgi:hypothetical protein